MEIHWNCSRQFSVTTYMDVGSAENAGAIFSHSIHGDSLELFPTILSIHSIHGDSLELFPTILSIHSIHGDKKRKTKN